MCLLVIKREGKIRKEKIGKDSCGEKQRGGEDRKGGAGSEERRGSEGKEREERGEENLLRR